MWEETIDEFFADKNFDVKFHRNARWIDQKCTPDVLTIVADCISNFAECVGKSFSAQEIWFSDYTTKNVQDIFRKVEVKNVAAANEYDKFFSQPMKLFAYAGLLNERREGNKNIYSIVNFPILQFISIRERNALMFLTKYIQKVLADSGLSDEFEIFFAKQNKQAYDNVKSAFYDFTVQNTAIGKRGSSGWTECGRIFTKILNVLAFQRNKRGTERGHLSRHPITYDMLMYNRDNFRDIYAEKPKNVSRKEFLALHPLDVNEAYNQYSSAKAKKRLRLYNDTFRHGKSELEGDTEYATHIHHIFPAGMFPEISAYLENLIALTPNQHLNKAHPNGRTNEIDRDFQRTFLLVKTDMIEENIKHGDEIVYSFGDFMYVLSVGLEDLSFLEIESGDYLAIKNKIESAYA